MGWTDHPSTPPQIHLHLFASHRVVSRIEIYGLDTSSSPASAVSLITQLPVRTPSFEPPNEQVYCSPSFSTSACSMTPNSTIPVVSSINSINMVKLDSHKSSMFRPNTKHKKFKPGSVPATSDVIRSKNSPLDINSSSVNHGRFSGWTSTSVVFSHAPVPASHTICVLPPNGLIRVPDKFKTSVISSSAPGPTDPSKIQLQTTDAAPPGAPKSVRVREPSRLTGNKLVTSFPLNNHNAASANAPEATTALNADTATSARPIRYSFLIVLVIPFPSSKTLVAASSEA
jgi:hypothetical protein